MSSNWTKILKTVATQLGLAVSLVAIDQTVRSFVNHKFKQYTTKKKQDQAIEVKPAEPPSVVEPPQDTPANELPTETKPETPETPSAS